MRKAVFTCTKLGITIILLTLVSVFVPVSGVTTTAGAIGNGLIAYAERLSGQPTSLTSP